MGPSSARMHGERREARGERREASSPLRFLGVTHLREPTTALRRVQELTDKQHSISSRVQPTGAADAMGGGLGDRLLLIDRAHRLSHLLKSLRAILDSNRCDSPEYDLGSTLKEGWGAAQ